MFFLQHVPTKKFLFIDYKKSLFNDRNCRGCPIIGQREVSLTDKKDKQCLWKVTGGIIFSLSEDEETETRTENESEEEYEEEEKKNDL